MGRAERSEPGVSIAIVGVGETDYAWKDPRAPAELAVDAVQRALADAGLTGADVDGIVTESYTLSHGAPADLVASRIGVRDRAFSAHLGIAGSGTVGAPGLARMAIEAGEASVVVSYYSINLSSRGAGGAYAIHAGDRAKAAFEMPFGYYGQAVYFAAAAARYRHLYGLEYEQLGAVALAARAHAQRTPNALRREPLTMEAFLDNPIVADPLRKLDCCLVNDGGVAFVMTSLERARDLPHPPAVVAGVGFGSKPVPQSGYFSQAADLLTTAATYSGPRAYRQAGLTAADVDVAEIYDCFTISMLLQLEDLGFAAKGEGAAFIASGATGPGGELPVNTHGGLLSQSYLVGGNHVVEAVRQLRGDRGEAQVEGAEVALVAGLGAPEHATLLLTVDR
jgi:acetyl-CoA acetyltransferase